MRAETATTTADKRTKHDSLRQHIFTILLLTITIPAMSAPLHRHSRSRHARSHHGLPDRWWFNPCGAPGGDSHHQPPTPRGGACHGPLKFANPIKKQIEIFTGFYDPHWKTIEDFYRNMSCVFKNPPSYKWIPDIPKIRDFKNKPVEALITFHKDLQSFAAALYLLQSTDLKTASTTVNFIERNELLHNLTEKLRSVMCEAETTIHNSCPNRVLERITNEHQNIGKDLIMRPDLTKMCIQDRGVLRAFRGFFKGWQKVLKKVLRKPGKKNNKKHNKNTPKNPKAKQTSRRAGQRNNKTEKTQLVS